MCSSIRIMIHRKAMDMMLLALIALLFLVAPGYAARPMENLGRGVVAVRASDSEVLVTWRRLGLDEDSLGFNVYRAAGNAAATKLNSAVLNGGTNFVDSTANLKVKNTYHVRPVAGGKEQAPSGSFTLSANNDVEPIVRISIKNTGNIKYVWVGDLDGDGEYDYVLDRHNTRQSIEAYTSNGTFLWEVNLGPNSENHNNIEPSSTTISVGNWDGVTVFDFDSDGKAEVAIRVANGVVFGNGKTFDHPENENHQYVAILNGLTGALRDTAPIPRDYLSDGPLAARFGVGYLDGERPYLYAFMKNRQPEQGAFNRVFGAWTFDGTAIKEEWITFGNFDAPDGHNTRIIDVNGDGKDEVAEIGFVLNGDGKVLYEMPDLIVHGDRFHIAKMDPSRSGLQGYGVQQRNPRFLLEYYYDAATGKLLWEHYSKNQTEVIDNGRGMADDIDPTQAGFETWSFYGVYNAPKNKLQTSEDEGPCPHLSIWWDGDELRELYNDGKIEKWDWKNPTTSGSIPRLETISKYGGQGMDGRYPGFIGDIMGDWREEVIVTNANYNELIIFTTDLPTDIRLYTLAHNPAYRNAMTLKGYMQSHYVDYFLGHGMSKPGRPNIRYV